MGSVQSSTTEKTKLQYLGDRYPFGDAEIVRLERCYLYLQARGATDRFPFPSASFLSRWAAVCGTLPPAGGGDDSDNDEALSRRHRERAALMEIVERRILPAGFGAALERAFFVTQGDFAENNANCSHRQALQLAQSQSQLRTAVTAHAAPRDDETFAGFEQFLDGLSNCSRRGSRAILSAVFRLCLQKQAEAGAGDFHSYAPASVQQLANPHEIVTLLYRIALATSFLLAASSDEDGSATIPDPAEYVPQEMGRSLTDSLLDFCTRKRTTASTPDGGTTFGLPPVAPFPTTSAHHDANTHESVVLEDFLEWAEATAPCLSGVLATFLHQVFFAEQPYPPSRTPFLWPNVHDQQSAFFDRLSSPLFFTFACMSTSLGGRWVRLFTSDQDGLSFNRLQDALLGYSGPTLLIVRSTTGGVFGAFSSSTWKEAPDFYGNSDCFLHRIEPSTRVYRPRGRASNYMYCNSQARSRGYDGLAHGIGFGGTTEQPRLFIAESLEGCVAASADLTFEMGPLLPTPPHSDSRGDAAPPSKYFDVDALEVWAVGGEDVVLEGLSGRRKQRDIVAANIRKARKVDKAQFLEDFQSGLLESKAFKHRQEMQERHDVNVEELQQHGNKP